METKILDPEDGKELLQIFGECVCSDEFMIDTPDPNIHDAICKRWRIIKTKLENELDLS